MKFTTQEKTIIWRMQEAGADLEEIAFRLGCDPKLVRTYIRRTENLNEYAVKRGMAPKEQKCWHCGIATGMPSRRTGDPCPWAARGRPVPGWDAVRTTRIYQEKHGRRDLGGWRVVGCPLFEPEKGEQK